MIPLIKSTFYNESESKKELADFILESKVLSMLAKCRRFEKKF